MKIKRILYNLPILFIGLTVFSQSCDSSKIAITNLDSSKITQIYNVKVGDTLKIEFISNPSTGYKWELSSKIEPKIVKFIDSEYIADEKPVNMVGSGGVDTWSYLVKKTGVLFLKYSYVREPDAVGNEKYFKIIVE
jgi:predicted secreted protein